MKPVRLHPPAGTAHCPDRKGAGLRLGFQPHPVKTSCRRVRISVLARRRSARTSLRDSPRLPNSSHIYQFGTLAAHAYHFTVGFCYLASMIVSRHGYKNRQLAHSALSFRYGSGHAHGLTQNAFHSPCDWDWVAKRVLSSSCTVRTVGNNGYYCYVRER